MNPLQRCVTKVGRGALVLGLLAASSVEGRAASPADALADAPSEPGAESECPVQVAKEGARCTAEQKESTTACDLAVSIGMESCVEERKECLEAEKAARGIGPARPSECAPKFLRCANALRRIRALCVLEADHDKGRCTDAVAVRAARCARDAATGEAARKKGCTALCRAEGQSAVNECQRVEKTELRRLQNDRDAWYEGCAGDEDPQCREAGDYLYNDGAMSAQGLRAFCVKEAQDGILPCIRSCSAEP